MSIEEEETSVRGVGSNAIPVVDVEEEYDSSATDDYLYAFDSPPGLDDMKKAIFEYELAQKRMGAVTTPATLRMQNAVRDFMEVTYDFFEALVEELSTGG